MNLSKMEKTPKQSNQKISLSNEDFMKRISNCGLEIDVPTFRIELQSNLLKIVEKKTDFRWCTGDSPKFCSIKYFNLIAQQCR